MNLNNFKNTWRYFKLTHQMEVIDATEILNLIEEPNCTDFQRFRGRLLPNSAMFGVLILFCQSC